MTLFLKIIVLSIIIEVTFHFVFLALWFITIYYINRLEIYFLN